MRWCDAVFALALAASVAWPTAARAQTQEALTVDRAVGIAMQRNRDVIAAMKDVSRGYRFIKAGAVGALTQAHFCDGQIGVFAEGGFQSLKLLS